MKNLKLVFVLSYIFFIMSGADAQTTNCTDFNAVMKLMETGFSTAKASKGTKTETNYGVMILTKTIWTSNYKFPESLYADITEILRQAPDPKMAGHNIYISFNFAKNVTKDVAEATFNKIKDKIKSCTPANWKMKETSGPTYTRYMLMDGPYYDDAPHKVTLYFNKMDGVDKYTVDMMFDTAIK